MNRMKRSHSMLERMTYLQNEEFSVNVVNLPLENFSCQSRRLTATQGRVQRDILALDL